MSKLKPEEYLNRLVMIIKPIKYKGIIGTVKKHLPIGTLYNDEDSFYVDYVDSQNCGIFKQSCLHVLTEKEIQKNKV